MTSRLLAVLVLAVASGAVAQETTSIPEFALERFRLTEVGRGGLGAATGDTLPKYKFRAFLAFHYENNPLVYLRNNVRAGALVEHRLTTHVGLGFGITSWLTAAAELPIVLFQSGDDLSQIALTASPDKFGVGSPWVALRLGILSQRKGGLVGDAPFDLAFQLGTALPFGVGKSYSIESGFNLAPQLSIGRDLGPVRIGGELSSSIRTSPITLTYPVPVSPRDAVGSQLGLRLLVSSTGQGARFEGSFHTGIALTGDLTPPGFELLVGGRVPIGPVELFALGGPGFGNLPGTPLIRVLAGVGIRPDADKCSEGEPHTPAECPELDDDNDGVRNGKDMCPSKPEDLDNFQDDDGCPEPDNDDDGIFDVDDKCPMKPGVAKYNGCPAPKPQKEKDTDKDGLVDSKDECPTEPGPIERKGCPEKDTDGDGLLDSVDACPTEAGPKETRGCPVKDRDGDTVEDHVDNCPDDKGPVENQGCPAAQKQLVIITKEKLVIKEKVFFATGKATILSKSFELLNQVAKVLRDHEEIAAITIEGHTDNVGRADYNRKLSRSRAESVRNYLVFQGVDSARLNAVGYGPDKPADTNKTEGGRANNRRVEFMIETAETTKVRTE